ncbi:MAG: M20/M25/M40 family metallo-hydrolase [Sphingobacteriales bacterium]|nr:M20/M25/M40 family metallo-hydrolase [Sphingobacteriales bacterium]MBI3717812.1 M20/M25/M40 family metallo-hydrolase [Sphingobacteriales bacterium]
MRKLLLPVLALISISVSAQEKVDIETINKIIAEEKNNSKVMDIVYHLTDVSGPRLTNSPGWFRAANYAIDQLKGWGADNAQLEEWGNFGRGWEVKKSYIALTAPYYKPIIAYPKTWTRGTNGLVNAELVLVTVKDSTELDKYAGKLAGKIVLINRTDIYKQSFKADASRYTDAELDSMANIKPDTSTRQNDSQRFARFMAMQRTNTLIKQIAEKEGAIAMLTTGLSSHDGTVFAQNPTGLRTPKEDGNGAMLEMAVAYEDFMTLSRFAKEGIAAKVELDVQSQFTGNETKAYDVIGEIKGTDPKLKNEIVMLGAHLDSWHAGTGATDNAAGSAVMLEVMRIFKALNLHPRRTIRIALWSGEEQGLLGSRGYVTNHFGDRKTMALKPEQQLVSGYFNIDNGTGKVRGVYLEGNEKVKSIFAYWLKPFNEMGAKTLTLDKTGGTDHISFNDVGIPGFQFIQDEIEYDTRTHHSNMDVYDHLIPDDMKQIATVVATFVYNTAQRDEKLPRKELPKPSGR